MAYKRAVVRAVRRRLHHDFRGHEGLSVRPEQRTEAVSPDQAALRLHDKDAPGLFRKRVSLWRTHHDVELAARHKIDCCLDHAIWLSLDFSNYIGASGPRI